MAASQFVSVASWHWKKIAEALWPDFRVEADGKESSEGHTSCVLKNLSILSMLSPESVSHCAISQSLESAKG